MRGSKMGGYFLEGSRNVIATGNLCQQNASRGATIERDSTGCILSENVLEFNGREGLWAPAVAEIMVNNNTFAGDAPRLEASAATRTACILEVGE